MPLPLREAATAATSRAELEVSQETGLRAPSADDVLGWPLGFHLKHRPWMCGIANDWVTAGSFPDGAQGPHRVMAECTVWPQ